MMLVLGTMATQQEPSYENREKSRFGWGGGAERSYSYIGSLTHLVTTK